MPDMNFASNVFQLKDDIHSFAEILLTPIVILKAQGNNKGGIINFIIKSINDSAALSLDLNKKNALNSCFFPGDQETNKNELFKKLCSVEENGFPFYRKNFKDFPFNRLKNNIHIKAGKSDSYIILT